MLKKRDRLLEVLKNDERYHLTHFLTSSDIAMLSLTAKRYYMQLVPVLNSMKLDEQQVTKQTKVKISKQKVAKQKKQQAANVDMVEVDIQKVPLHKFAKMQLGKKEGESWIRVQQLKLNNEFLLKKLESRTVVFFENSVTGELVYINRSMVDPNLNYNKGGFGQDFINSKIYEHLYTQGQTNDFDFSSMEAILKRQKQLLEKIQLKKEEEIKNSVVSFESELQKAFRMKRFGIILCFGGSFSFGIFENGRCVLHKSDKKYVCRKKAGERQLNRDKQSGSGIQSMGSQIRRDQEKKHVINVGEILKEHLKDLSECEIIFLQAPGLNRLFVINQNENLDGLQDRLRSVCITAKKANFTEIEALYDTIGMISIVHTADKEEKQVRQFRKGKKEKRND